MRRSVASGRERDACPIIDMTRLESALAAVEWFVAESEPVSDAGSQTRAAQRCSKFLRENGHPEVRDAIAIRCSRAGLAWPAGATAREALVLVAWPDLDRRRRSEIAKVLTAVKDLSPRAAAGVVEAKGLRELARASALEIHTLRAPHPRSASARLKVGK